MSAPVHDPSVAVAPPMEVGPVMTAPVKTAVDPVRRARSVTFIGYFTLLAGYVVAFFIPRVPNTVGHRVVMAVSFLLLIIGVVTAVWGIVKRTMSEL